jgi:hypothetical protein
MSVESIRRGPTTAHAKARALRRTRA